MREILTISVGRSGVLMGCHLWDLLLDSHGVDLEGKSPAPEGLLDTYFEESKEKTHRVPRALFVDLEPATCDATRSKPFGKLLLPGSFVSGQTGCCNNWAKGYYTEGAELVDQVMDQIRASAERADCIQGFQVMHSMDGGTGGGMGALIIDKIQEEFPDKIASSFGLITPPGMTDTTVGAYNFVLAATHLAENADLVHVMDAEALCSCFYRTLKLGFPREADMGRMMATAILGATATFRYPGCLINPTMQSYATNMVPFPRLHFLSLGAAPLLTKSVQPETEAGTAQEIVKRAFDGGHSLTLRNNERVRYLAGALNLVGEVLPWSEVVPLLPSADVVEWLPDAFKAELIRAKRHNYGWPRLAATLVANSSAIQERLRLELENFAAMYRRKAFLHYYTREGMDEMEFIEAEQTVQQLAYCYQDCLDAPTIEDGWIREMREEDERAATKSKS